MGGPLLLVFFRQLYYTGVQSAGIVMLLPLRELAPKP